MKFSLFIVCFLAFAAGIVNANLDDDLNQIASLIPKNKIIAIGAKHLIFNKQFRDFKKFLESPEFSKIWDVIVRDPAFRKIVNFVEKTGVKFINVLNELAKALKLAEYPKDARTMRSRSLMSFFDEVIGALPKADMSKLMKEKMQTSPEFKNLINQLSSPEFEALVDEARGNLAQVETDLKNKGLDTDKVIATGHEIIGWAK